MPALTLVSFDACPFVQRAAIMLQEQGRAYDIEYIDLAARPEWFLKISPLGKVPVLLVDGDPLFESVAILEYLDETADGGRLLPESPVARAKQRMWIIYIGNIMSKAWQLQAATEERSVRMLADELRGHFAELEKQLPEGGAFWGGEAYTMVDAAVAPILQRLTWAETLEPSLGLFADLPKVRAWRDALLARPSTTAAIVPDLEQRSARMLSSIGGWIARAHDAGA